jgi:hypothetical protein
MINDFPYLYRVDLVCGAGRIVILCAMCFDERVPRGMDFMSLYAHTWPY